MKISNNLNKYTNSLIKEFNSCDFDMCVTVGNTVMHFVPNEYDFKTVREIFKEVSLFPLKDNKRISFRDIRPGELLECIKRFKEWANLNGFEFKDDVQEWNRIYEMYK
jgi:hypothetical protein